MEYVKALFIGMSVGIRYWHVVVFNRKIPVGICWLIAILMIPINILVMVVGTIINRYFVEETFDEMVEDLEEKEAE